MDSQSEAVAIQAIRNARGNSLCVDCGAPSECGGPCGRGGTRGVSGDTVPRDAALMALRGAVGHLVPRGTAMG